MKKTAAKATSVSLLSLVVLGCAGDPPPFDPRSYHPTPPAGAATVPSRQKPPLPTTPQSTATTRPAGGTVPADAPTVRLPLQEVIQRAVANNQEVKVAGYDPAIEETREIEAFARFDPSFFMSGSYETQRLLSPSGGAGFQADPFSPSTFRQLTGRTGIRQNLPVGSQVEISYGVSRIQRDPDFQVGQTPDFQPITQDTYTVNDLLVRVTQPLLRDFGTDVNRARITIARNTHRVSVLEFRRTLEDILAQTEQTYWQLVQAEREVRIQEDLLNRTIDTYNILERRFVAGVDVSRVQVSQASLSVESRRAVLVRARTQVGNLSDQLKRFMNDPELPVSGDVVVLPGNNPLEEPINFDYREQFETAMENRFELGQQRIRIDSAYITQRVGANNLLPQLNLTGSATFQGAGSDVGQALKRQRQFDDISSSIGLELEIPIGNRAARAIYRRTQLQRIQAIAQYRGLVNQIEAELTTALREIETTWREIVQRRLARFAAADALLALQQREDAGEPLTPTFVQLELDTQERLANAEAEEAAAISNYNIAISRLERAKGTLLRYNNVIMDEDTTPSLGGEADLR